MASKYAKTTRTSVANSRTDIEKTLLRYGCDCFGYMQSADSCKVQFEYEGRSFQFVVEHGETDQETRQRWRIALLWIKSSLEMVEAELTTLEHAFAMWTLLPSGETVGEVLEGKLALIAAGGNLPKLTG